MASTAIKGKVCDLCGADVRNGSQFCYNCGTDVSAVSKPDVPIGSAVLPTVAETKNGAERLPDPLPTPAKPVRPPRRPRTRTIETRDISWEEPSGASVAFIVAAIVFAIVTLAILIVAFYIR
jgi:hypothetical protein